MSLVGCSHLQLYKKNPKNKESFKWIHAVFVVGISNKCRKTRICNSYCRVCKKRGPYLHACLECVFFGCMKHIREHAKTHKHTLTMDLIYGQIHCNLCGDYIYDSDMENIMKENKMQSGTFRKRLFESTSWYPTQEERSHLTSKTKKICITPESTIGLRGLINLGATCFMNCIVQALMHTPLLRDYFLTECHKCKGKPETCIVCEISELFQEFYRGATVPLALDHLLHLIWMHAKYLADYKQHDAHEFLVATLDVLHHHYLESMPPPKSSNGNVDEKCPCIIDKIFTGGLQKDVVCQICNGVSTTVDPISNFSLDVSPITSDGEQPSLIDCLEHYTRVELLDDDDKIMCSKCQSLQTSTLQQTIKTLPIVASFHLKRFQYSEKVEKIEKISTSITFPEMLDMTPFIGRAKKESPFPSDNRYTLFAVINHLGNSMNEGHYIAYVRQQQDFWYKCDDHVITRANLEEVLNSEGYLLFYHKHVLSYE
ncbi:hypothetical protein WA026_008957 [Henosepilachna vigintioctopunctata]|uniref:Ubiquitin carboxyl-terminal hydrolase n=1 Tax=Henosepilachna vigintioctopunctata TaxID=420089 RepID=A0AAW1VAV9_9CUCU